jgi:hypothetical protein
MAEEDGLDSQLVTGRPGLARAGMSLVSNTQISFDRIASVYARPKEVKSDRSSSKSSRKSPRFAPETVAISAGMIEHWNVGPDLLDFD